MKQASRLSALSLAAIVWLTAPARGAEGVLAQQPIQYNHKVHAGKLAIDCTKCHAGTESRQRAGFPPDLYCQACHSAPQSNSAEEAKLIDMLDDGTPLAWKQVTQVAEYVFFSHRRHVAVANIDCAVCHGDMPSRTVPIGAPFVSFRGRPGMQRCIACHRESGSPYAGTGCVDCHR